MPGFQVNAIGDFSRPGGAHPIGTADFYYKYGFGITQLFAGGGNTGFSPSNALPLIYLRDATLPTFSVEKEYVEGANLEYKFAKSVKWEDVRIAWYDTDGLVNIMRTWRESVWTPEGGIQSPSTYKTDSYLNTYLPNGAVEVSWWLVNSWPSSIRHGELTYTESDVKLVEVTLTYDWAYENATEADVQNAFVPAGTTSIVSSAPTQPGETQPLLPPPGFGNPRFSIPGLGPG